MLDLTLLEKVMSSDYPIENQAFEVTFFAGSRAGNFFETERELQVKVVT